MQSHADSSDRLMEAVNHSKNNAMDARDHFKNGASLKSHTSRVNLKALYSRFIVLILLIIAGCENDPPPLPPPPDAPTGVTATPC